VERIIKERYNMDLKLVREIVSMMENSKLSSMEIEIKDMRIKLEKSTGDDEKSITIKNRFVEEKHYETVTTSEPEVVSSDAAKVEAVSDAQCTIIKAPMVGTYYGASSPDSEPFVTEGMAVKKGDTICIIEAMKLMNEIESECSGTISEVLVKDGDMVEYGQPLFKIKM
jgi:acetyl-CoA carboxylase biotin carboxyl carrier protein